MKKFLFIFVSLIISINLFSQTIIKPNTLPLNTRIGNFLNGGNVRVWLNVDISNNYYLALEHRYKTINEDINAYNFHNYELKEMIKKDNNLYIKLNNDSIITLTCISYYFDYLGSELESYGHSIEWVYTTKASSIFKLSDSDITLLKTYDIIKLRLQLKDKFIDIETKEFKPHNIISSGFNELQKRYENYIYELNQAKQNEIEQEKMKNNPLYNF